MHPIIRIILETVASFAVLGMMIYGAFYYIAKGMFEAEPIIECPIEINLREDHSPLKNMREDINKKLFDHGVFNKVDAYEIRCYYNKSSLQGKDYRLIVASRSIHDIFIKIREKYIEHENLNSEENYDENKSGILFRYDRDIVFNNIECTENCDAAFRFSNFGKVYDGLDKMSTFYSLDKRSMYNTFFSVYISLDYEEPIIIFSWGR